MERRAPVLWAYAVTALLLTATVTGGGRLWEPPEPEALLDSLFS